MIIGHRLTISQSRDFITVSDGEVPVITAGGGRIVKEVAMAVNFLRAGCTCVQIFHDDYLDDSRTMEEAKKVLNALEFDEVLEIEIESQESGERPRWTIFSVVRRQK